MNKRDLISSALSEYLDNQREDIEDESEFSDLENLVESIIFTCEDPKSTQINLE